MIQGNGVHANNLVVKLNLGAANGKGKMGLAVCGKRG